MTDTAPHDARTVFAGLVPQQQLSAAPRSAVRSRASQGMFATVPIVLVGSMAAMALNLTGPVEPAEAKSPHKPSDIGKTVRGAVAAPAAETTARTTSPAPATYLVEAGDTVSEIAGRFGLSTASVLALNGLSWSSMIFPGQELKLTASGSSLPTVAAAAASAPRSERYTIAQGDTISAIADRFGVSTLSVLTANGLSWSSIIYPGQTLAIPGSIGVSEAAPVAEEAADEFVPVAHVTPLPAPEVPVAAAPPAAPPVAAGGSYTIVSGDTISGIASKFGVSVDSLLAANSLTTSSLIFSGDSLVIPSATTASTSTTSSSGGSSWSDGNITSMNDEMRSNAAVIVQVGRDLGVSDYGIVIALATAMQESTLRNLDWGDRDSLGLFQQRPSSGWGTAAQLTTPAHAAALFYGGPSNPNAGYTRGLLDISGWESMPLTVAAQRVQISAYPDAYAKWEASARAWLAELG